MSFFAQVCLEKVRAAVHLNSGPDLFEVLPDLQPPAGGYGPGLLGQGERQHAVSIGGGDILAPDAGDVEAPGLRLVHGSKRIRRNK